jgi:hypothetical protein
MVDANGYFTNDNRLRPMQTAIDAPWSFEKDRILEDGPMGKRPA